MIFDSTKKDSKKLKFTSRNDMLEHNEDNKKDYNGLYPCLCKIPYPVNQIDAEEQPKIKNLCKHCGGNIK